MKQVQSLLDFGDSAAIERINFGVAKVIENLQNPNTDEKTDLLSLMGDDTIKKIGN